MGPHKMKVHDIPKDIIREMLLLSEHLEILRSDCTGTDISS
jgi:hypothetical protein